MFTAGRPPSARRRRRPERRGSRFVPPHPSARAWGRRRRQPSTREPGEIGLRAWQGPRGPRPRPRHRRRRRSSRADLRRRHRTPWLSPPCTSKVGHTCCAESQPESGERPGHRRSHQRRPAGRRWCAFAFSPHGARTSRLAPRRIGYRGRCSNRRNRWPDRLGFGVGGACVGSRRASSAAASSCPDEPLTVVVAGTKRMCSADGVSTSGGGGTAVGNRSTGAGSA